ncbi:MAG: prolipoprotein diacylglyceryl transferase family protein [Anaerolineales bacterium]
MRVAPYTARIILGTGAGLVWLWYAAPRHGFSRRALTGLVWLAALGALLGGRLGYVLEHLLYFRENPAHLLNLLEVGGFDGAGAWWGGLCGVGLWTLRRAPACRPTLTLLIPAALLVAAGAWWGCADRGCAWGQEVRSAPRGWGWLVREGPDLYHTLAPRLAVQHLGALLALGGALSSMFLRSHALLVAALYAAATSALTFLRADPEPLVGALRLDFVLLLGLALFFVTLQLTGRESRRQREKIAKRH